MCKLSLSILVIAVAGTLNAWAVVVECSNAGQLHSLITDVQIDQLTVSGVIDVRDIDFISSSLTELKSLDMSGASIAGYTCGADETYFDCDGTFASNELPRFCFFGKQYSSVKLPSDLESIGEAALAGMTSMTHLELPATVSKIGDYAVNGSGIINLTLPIAVSEMGKGAFSSCESLQEVEILSSTVGEEAFARCRSLRRVTFGDNVKIVGDGAFAGCHNLGEVIVGENSSLATIGDRAFIDTSIAGSPFASCRSLSQVGKWAFANTMVEQAFLPENMKELPEGIYFNAAQVRDALIPSNAVSIGKYALYNCNGVSSLSIPASVGEIDDYALAGMQGLQSIHSYPTDVPQLGENVFAAINQQSVNLVVDAGVADAYRNADQWKEFKIEASSGIKSVEISENVVKARFSGSLLSIWSDIDMLRVVVVDASGAVMDDMFPSSQYVTVDTEAWCGNFYILSVTLANNKTKIIKLIR